MARRLPEEIGTESQSGEGAGYEYRVDREGPLLYRFATGRGVFFPTQTSELLIRAARQAISRPSKVLDLGCGMGVCGLVLGKLGLAAEPVYLSDLSPEAIPLALQNARGLHLNAVVRQGSLFDPWEREHFDVIVGDVSGVSEEVAKLSPWFPEGVSCGTGRDGTALIGEVLRQAPRFLNPKGFLLFPVLSLSDEGKILEEAHRRFREVSLVAHQLWFLPEQMEKSFERLEPLLKEGIIRLEHKFGRWLWSTSVYKASLGNSHG